MLFLVKVLVMCCTKWDYSGVFVVLSSRRSLSSAVQRRVWLNDFIIGRFRGRRG